MIGIKPLCQGLECPFQSTCDHSDEACIKNLKNHIANTNTSENNSETEENEELRKRVATLQARQDSDALLRIMNKCIQRETDRRTVGHYVIESGEMSRMENGDELHILTNEYMNYDFTPISSLAIAINTKKGIHYYYYGTSDQEKDVLGLKERIKGYYSKGMKARQKVICWIRQAKSSIIDYNEFLRSLCGSSILSIVESIINGSNIKNKEKTIRDIISETESLCGKNSEYKMPGLASLKRVLDWIAGAIFSDETQIYDFIDNIGILTIAMKDKKELLSDNLIKDFCDKIQLLLDMKELTIWQTRSDYEIDKGKIDYLFNVFKYKDDNAPNVRFNELISAPVRQWLEPKENEIQCGQDNCTEAEKDEWANNIHFCTLNEGQPYTLCYSFTLFLSNEEPAAAWYTTYRNNDCRDNNAIDNDLFMIDFKKGDELLVDLENAFRTLIMAHCTAKKILVGSKSRIIEFLGIMG